MVAQLMSSATAITRPSSKQIDTDTQARVVLDRMALDIGQMLKRTDVDYFIKGPATYNSHGHGQGHGWGHGLGTNQLGSDQIAFFSQVRGYYPAGYTSEQESPISLVAYRVNQGSTTNNPSYMRLERMSKGLGWNALISNPNTNSPYPIVFLPQTIAGVGKPWSPAINNTSTCSGNNNSCDPDYETVGAAVFRFEYYYLLKNGRLTDVPWNRDVWPTRQSLTDPTNIGLTEVEAIGVTIAVIDPAGRALIDAASSSSLLDLASDLNDFASAHGRGIGNQTRYIGMLESDWKGVLFGDASQGLPGIVNTARTSAGSPVPPEAAKAIRVYNRYFDLKSL